MWFYWHCIQATSDLQPYSWYWLDGWRVKSSVPFSDLNLSVHKFQLRWSNNNIYIFFKLAYDASTLIIVLGYYDALLSTGTLCTKFLLRKIVGEDEKKFSWNKAESTWKHNSCINARSINMEETWIYTVPLNHVKIGKELFSRS